MQIKVSAPDNIRAAIKLPASKSISNRALIINALSKGRLIPGNLSDCDDTNVMIKALSEENDTIDIRAAGTAMRFLTAFLSVNEGTKTITGTKRMQQRPIGILVDALRTLGAHIEYAGKEGFPPLRITGSVLAKEEISLKGDVSSQYISALLLIAPVLKHGLTLRLTGKIISKPYINLTLQLMRDSGAKAGWISENAIRIDKHPYSPAAFTVEADWSAASYWYEIVALSKDAEVELLGLFPGSYQGDSKVAGLFACLGIETKFTPSGVMLKKSGRLPERMDYDFINEPDLAQTFAVTCAASGIPFRFTGLQSLKIKETDRMAALIKELGKFGYALTEESDSGVSWDGKRIQTDINPVIDTYEDHRMAMSFAPLCLVNGAVRINDPQVVSKSYPHYWENLRLAGFNVTD